MALDKAIGARGANIVLLTRLSPLFPFNLLNYAYGLTKIKFRPYILASWVGMMPATLAYVYAGHLAGGYATSTALPQGPQLLLQGLGLVATFAVVVYVGRMAKKALQQKL